MSQVRPVARTRFLSAASKRHGSLVQIFVENLLAELDYEVRHIAPLIRLFFLCRIVSKLMLYDDLNRRVCLASCAGGVLCGRSAE